MTYDDLQAAILAWTNKPAVEQQMGLIITQAEAQMQRRLRVRKMVGRAEATIDNEFELVPADFAGVRSFHLASTPPIALEYIAPDALEGLKGQFSTAGRPIYYTIKGREFQFLPAPGSGFTGTLTYWRKIPALSADNTSNWLLEDHPDAYLYGCLTQAASFLGDDRLATWSALFSGALEEITTANRSESYGATLQTQSGLRA